MAYFPAILLVLAIMVAAVDTRLSGRTPTESLLRWLLFCSVGLGSLWGFVGHAFFAQKVAESIGWKTSPFQFEVAVASLGVRGAGRSLPVAKPRVSGSNCNRRFVFSARRSIRSCPSDDRRPQLRPE